MFSCEYCDIFKKTFFTEHLRWLLLSSLLKWWKNSQEILSLSFFLYRSSCPKVFYKKGFLKHFSRFKGKPLCQSLYFNKVAGLRRETLLKKRLWHRFFPMNFEKPLEHILQNPCRQLLLFIARNELVFKMLAGLLSFLFGSLFYAQLFSMLMQMWYWLGGRMPLTYSTVSLFTSSNTFHSAATEF